MSETPKPRVTKSYDRLTYGEDLKVLPLLATFIANGRGIGMIEDELVKQSGLNKDDALREVAKLENDGFVRSFICQEGTAGPFARRYRLVAEVVLKLDLSRPA